MEDSTSTKDFQSYLQAISQVRVFLVSMLITSVFIIRYSRNKQRFPNLPPGPPRIPLLGSIPWIDRSNPSKSIIKWAEKYGPVVTYYIGSKRFIAVNDAKLARELLVKHGDVFSARGYMPGGPDSWGVKGGVFFENGDDWKTHRRWVMTGLRHFGVGKRSLDNQLNTEARALCKEIKKETGKFDPVKLIMNATSNIICSISFGKRYEYDNPDFQNLLKNLGDVFNYTHVGKLEEAIPFLTKFHKKRNQYVQDIINFFNGHMEYHKKTFDENNIRDLIDMLLLQVKEEAKATENNPNRVKPGQPTYINGKLVSDDVDCIWRSILMLFLAGTDTTSTTIMWFLLYMISYQEVQKRIQDEIDAATDGGSRLLTPLDRLKVPYFEATILEVQRLCNTAVVLLPHKTTADFVVHGYDIPADTNFIATLKLIHTDPKYWKDPNVFKPERFMDVNETKVIKSDYFMPFGLGRRACLGEMLAKMEMYAFLSCLLQHFVLEIPETYAIPSFEPIPGISHSPRPFKLVAKARKTLFD